MHEAAECMPIYMTTNVQCKQTLYSTQGTPLIPEFLEGPAAMSERMDLAGMLTLA